MKLKYTVYLYLDEIKKYTSKKYYEIEDYDDYDKYEWFLLDYVDGNSVSNHPVMVSDKYKLIRCLSQNEYCAIGYTID